MWILRKGSVSVLLGQGHGADARRIAGMGAGTTVGEMALLEGGKRSSTIVCDEAVEAYDLLRSDFDTIQRDHPEVARKLYGYF